MDGKVEDMEQLNRAVSMLYMEFINEKVTLEEYNYYLKVLHDKYDKESKPRVANERDDQIDIEF